ncbi:MAG TPA: YggS family pyridoxal phosphate-dependent enzyme [Pseudomonadales bacterium]|nr:YggS family pyridoxal phosphate-dependent enzyme [Pseudomonadales bacterium]
MKSGVQDNIAHLRSEIATCCARYGRDAKEVNLLAVSKTVGVDRIREALDANQYHFGENYLQEAEDKIAMLGDTGAIWHYIGAIQSNKTASIARNFTWVHTVASEKVARRLDHQRPDDLPPLKVMVQVNVSGEHSKAGVSPAEVLPLIGTMAAFDRLEIHGLMAIPEAASDIDTQRASFRALRELKDTVKAQLGQALPHFNELSMGMSGDLEAAIAEGTTWLRIGTAIFGARTKQ